MSFKNNKFSFSLSTAKNKAKRAIVKINQASQVPNSESALKGIDYTKDIQNWFPFEFYAIYDLYY